MFSFRGREAVERVAHERGELAPLDRGPRVGGQVEHEAQIMQAEEPQAEQFLLVDEVADVGAGEARASGTGTVFAERALVLGEAGVAEVEPASPGERRAGARGARG